MTPQTPILLALPLSGEKFCQHFGRCDGLLLADWIPQTSTVSNIRTIARKETGCETLPAWLKSLGVQKIVAGGIGAGAQNHLRQIGIDFTFGYQGEDPHDVLRHFLQQPDLQAANPCSDHLEHHHHHCRD